MIGGDKDLVGDAQKELRRLFSDSDSLDGATAWAGEVLELEGVDPAAKPLRALRTLRAADRRLSTAAARYLVDAVAGRAPKSRLRPLNPHLK